MSCTLPIGGQNSLRMFNLKRARPRSTSLHLGVRMVHVYYELIDRLGQQFFAVDASFSAPLSCVMLVRGDEK